MVSLLLCKRWFCFVADSRGADGGFFVFGDLSVKIEGEFRLKFTLFEMRK
jgi:hypothetical protein